MVCDSACDVDVDVDADADAGEFESGDCSQSYDMLSQSSNVSQYIDEDSSFQFKNFEFY